MPRWKLDTFMNYVMDPFTEAEVRRPVLAVASDDAGVSLSLADFVTYVNGLEQLLARHNGRTDARLAAIEAAYDEVGIEWNGKTAVLACMPHVTPDYVRAHAAAVDDRRYLGLAINRMLRGKAAPGQGSYAAQVKTRYPEVLT